MHFLKKKSLFIGCKIIHKYVYDSVLFLIKKNTGYMHIFSEHFFIKFYFIEKKRLALI